MRIECGAIILGVCLVALALTGCGSSHQLIDQTAENSVSPLTAGSTSGPPRSRGSRNRNGAVGPSQEEAFSGLEQQGTGEFTQRGGFSNIAAPDRLPNGSEGITLNLLNVPVAQAAKSILGDVLKVNYTIAEKIAGTITIQTSAPMHKDAVVQVFESALKMNGAALVRGPDGSYRIVPAASAAQSGARFADARPNGPGTQIRVVALRHVSPSEMRRIIEPIAAQGSVISVDDARNLLVLAAGAGDLADIDRLIATFDVDWMRGMSVAFYPVKSSDPESIAKELEAVMGLDKEGPLRGTVRILPNRRLNSIMVISSRPGPLDTARKWIQQLDRVAETSEEQVFVYKTRNRSALELANLLSRVTSKDGGQQAGAGVAPRFDPTTVASEATSPQPAATSARANSAAIGVLPQPPAGGTGAGAGAAAFGGTAAPTTPMIAPGTSELDRTAFAPPSGPTQTTGRPQKIVPDEPNSALVITATRREYDRMLQILERLDTIPTQVMLEAVIAEVTLNDELKFGVKWKFGGKNGSRTQRHTVR